MLNDDEKQAVAQLIGTKPKLAVTVLEYSIYILPTLTFAIYGLWKQDYLAVLVAYGALLLLAISYLSYANSYSKLLQSALRKYEDAHPAEKSDGNTKI